MLSMLKSSSAPAPPLPPDTNPVQCLSCGPTCKRERQPVLPERFFDGVRVTLLSAWSKVDLNRRRDYSAATSSCSYPDQATMMLSEGSTPKSIDFTQFDAPYTEVVETQGFVQLSASALAQLSSQQKKVCIEPQLAQPIAPKPSLTDEYEACINGMHYYDAYSDDDCYNDNCFFENFFRNMDVGDRRCFSYEIQRNVMDVAYFFSEFSKRERVEKMGRAEPVKCSEIWEAERIVRHVKKPKESKTLFLVEWAGQQENGRAWPKTWEPAENLGPVLLHLYEMETGLKFTSDE